MQTSTQAPPTFEEVVQLLQRLNQVTADPHLQVQLGAGLMREIRYPIASFRQRFPNDWPSPQPQLF